MTAAPPKQIPFTSIRPGDIVRRICKAGDTESVVTFTVASVTSGVPRDAISTTGHTYLGVGLLYESTEWLLLERPLTLNPSLLTWDGHVPTGDELRVWLESLPAGEFATGLLVLADALDRWHE